MKALREDADDLARFAIDVEGLAQDGIRAGEPLLPIAVTEDDSVWRAGRIVLACEQAAENGGNAEERESAVGDVQAVDLFRLRAASDAHGITVVNAEVLKGVILFAVDEVIGGGDVEILDVDTRGGEPDANEFVGAGIRKRLEENTFEDAEDEGVAANAGGERNEGDGGEKRRAREAPEDLLHVEQECSHSRGLTRAQPRTPRDGRQSLCR